MSSKTENRRINIWINGKEVQNNIKDIQASYKKLINQQALMTTGSKEYLDHAKKIKQLKGYIDEHKTQIGSIATAWQRAKATIAATGFGVLGGNILTGMLTRVGGFFGGIMTGAAKMSDQMADIRKTTGMTTEEVEGLSAALSKIDTRTSTSDLREMAIVAGQLGIAKDDILSFVEAVDKTAVALGDEFTGGANEVASVVGKLRNVMGDIKTDNVGEDIMHISNALNELGAAGFATSPVVADFANRIGGVGITLGLTSGQVLGLSATLQELNVSTERGGTAVVKILQKMTTETGSFAAIAGMSIQDYTNLVNTDLYGAFTKVMEGSKKSGSSATALAGIIKELEIQGAGASEVFAKLGGNVGMMNEKVDLASTSLQNTDSVMNEFNLKNENLAGQWEKTKKVVIGLAMSIGQRLAPVIMSLAKGFTNMLEWIKRNSQAFLMLAKIIGISVITWASYVSVKKLAVLWSNKFYLAKLKEIVVEKAKQLIDKIGIALMALRILAYDAYTKKITMATAATRLFNIVSKASGLGLLVAGIVAVTAAFVAFGKSQSESAKAMAELKAKSVEAMRPIVQEKLELNALVAATMRTKVGTDERRKAIENLQTKYPDFLKNLNAETVSNEQLKNTLVEVNKEYDKKIRMAALEVHGKEIFDRAIKAAGQMGLTEKMVSDLEKKIAELQFSAMDPAMADAQKKQLQMQLDAAKSGYAENKQMYDEYIALYAEIQNKVDAVAITVGDDSGGFVLSQEGLNKETKLENKYIEVYKKLREKIKEVFAQMGMDHLSEQDKELQQVRNKYGELISINQTAQAEIAAKGKGATADEIATAKALASQLIDLEALKLAEIDAVNKKHEQEKLVARLDAQEKIRVALMNEEDKAIYDISSKYAELIELAEKYGFDTVELYKKMQEEIDKLNSKKKKDVLGWSDEQWSSFKTKVNKVIGYFQQLGQLISKINEIEDNRDQKKLNNLEKYYSSEQEKLETMYEKKNISESTYSKKKTKMDADYDAQRTEIERRMNNRKKESAKFEAIINTAAGVAEAIPNPLLVAFALAMGAAQIAAIETEPTPFEDGGYTAKSSSNSKPAGVVHSNEWVSPAWMVNSPVTGPVISQLESIRNSGNASRAPRLPQQARNVAQRGSDDANTSLLKTIANQNAQLLNYMSDPENRRAIIVHDMYTKYEGDIAEMQQLRKIS